MSRQSAREITRSVTVGTSRARATIIALALAIGALAAAVVVLWQPGPKRNDFSYASVAPARDALWTGSVIDGIGFAVAAVALGLAVCLLAPARGAAWANVGAVLTALGGIAFATALVASGVLGWYVTATEALPAEAGSTLMAYFEDNPARLAAVQVPGFLLTSFGILLLAVALWRAQSVPRWLPIAIATLTVLPFVLPTSRALDVIQAVHLGTLVIVAWFLWNAASGRRETSVDH